MFKKLKKNQKGFTLVELVVVIAILAVLSAMLVPRIMGNVEEARRQRELSEARTLASAIQVYNAEITADGGAVYTGTPLQNTDLPAELQYPNATDFPDINIVNVVVETDGNAHIVEIPAP